MENKAMADARLLGKWSNKNLSLGSMAAVDIAFSAEGTGWIHWSNVGGGFELMRFRWRDASGRDLTLDLYEYESGTWRMVDGRPPRQTKKQREDERIAVAYQITAGQDVVGNPATILEFDQPLIRGVVGNRFALE
jgi:hypothetical protein